MNALELIGVQAGYDGRQVLHGVDLAVPKGGVAAVFGANGAGKTTLLRAISGLIPATGAIAVLGRPLAGFSSADRARAGIAHVPEGRGTFVGFTVDQNLRLGAAARSDRNAIAADLADVYRRFPHLQDRRGQIAGTLSGGEQQMLAIGRALMLRPKLLLLDEPSFGLAPKILSGLLAALTELRQNSGLSILLVEQNPALVSAFADTIHLLENGRITISAPASDPTFGEALRRAYLGA